VVRSGGIASNPGSTYSLPTNNGRNVGRGGEGWMLRFEGLGVDRCGRAVYRDGFARCGAADLESGDLREGWCRLRVVDPTSGRERPLARSVSFRVRRCRNPRGHTTRAPPSEGPCRAHPRRRGARAPIRGPEWLQRWMPAVRLFGGRALCFGRHHWRPSAGAERRCSGHRPWSGSRSGSAGSRRCSSGGQSNAALLLRGVLGTIRLEPKQGDVGRPYYLAQTSIDCIALLETPPGAEAPDGGSNSLQPWRRRE